MCSFTRQSPPNKNVFQFIIDYFNKNQTKFSFLQRFIQLLFESYNFNHIIKLISIQFNNFILMILKISTVIIIFFILYLWYKFYYIPQKELKRYKTILTDLGYRVFQRPFKFFGLSILQDAKNGSKKHGDALFYQKSIHPQFDIVLGNALDRVTFSIIRADLMKEFLSAEMIAKYTKIQMLLSGVKEMIGGGMFFAEGEQWKNRRKIMSKLFTFELLKENITKIAQISEESFQEFDQDHRLEGNQVKYNVMNLVGKTLNAVMMRCFFGCHQIKQKLEGKPFEIFVMDILQEVSELCISPLVIIFGKHAFRLGLTPSIRKINRKIRLFRQKCSQIIKKRTEQVLSSQKPEVYSDIIQALIWEKKNNPNQLTFLQNDLISQFITFLLGGTDTTSRFFTMMIYYISNQPSVYQKIKEEINQKIPDDKTITSQNLKNLTYLQNVFNQSIRLYNPTVYPLRIATEDNLLKNIPISKGCLAAIQPISNHYNEAIFEKPLEFRPQRWEKQCQKVDAYTFMPFSGGPRSCIGRQLAIIQTKIILIKLVKRYDSIVAQEQKIKFTYDFLYDFSPFQTVFSKKS